MAFYNFGNKWKWFMARVVDIEDPEKMGRVKIRIIHEQTGELGEKMAPYGISDDELLWAWPMSAIQSASLAAQKINEHEEYTVPDWIRAVGLSPTGAAEGGYVFGFYLDAEEENIPIIFGNYHKISRVPEPPTGAGGKMMQRYPPGASNFYYDISALALGDDYIFDANGNKTIIDIGQTLPKYFEKNKLGLKQVDEPEDAYDTKYPYNLTYTTKSGHAIELDDTVGHERIHIYHQSGSYEEIGNGPPKRYSGKNYKGRRVVKTVDDSFEIVMKDKNEQFNANNSVEVANCQTISVKNNQYVTVSNNQTFSVGNNHVIDVKGNHITIVGDNHRISIDGDSNITIEGEANISVQGGIKIKAPGGVTVQEGSVLVNEALGCASAATGAFVTSTGQTITVLKGIVTNIS